MTSLPSRCGRADRPAPDVPLAEVDDDVGGRREPGRDQRSDGEDHRDRVAARVGDALRRSDLGALAGQFGQPVCPRLLVSAAVVLLVRRRVDEAMIGTQVDQALGRVEGRGQPRGRAVRQRKEHEVGAVEGLGGRLGEPQPRHRAQVRMQLAHQLAGIAVCGDGDDLEVGMRRHQAQHLAAGVSAGSGDRDPIPHVHNYASCRNFMQTRVVGRQFRRLRPCRRRCPPRSGLRCAQAADPLRAPQMQAYMKSAMPFLGVRVPIVRRLSRDLAQRHPIASRPELELVVRELWDGAAYREERYAATALLDTRAARALRSPDLLPLYRDLIVSGAWWDHVDEIAHRVGELRSGWPEVVTPDLRAWAVGGDIWLRRVSIICQLGAKQHTDLELLTAAIDASADEGEFFLRKAIGWALRDYARTDPDWVRAFVAARNLSPLSQREALKHL